MELSNKSVVKKKWSFTETDIVDNIIKDNNYNTNNICYKQIKEKLKNFGFDRTIYDVKNKTKELIKEHENNFVEKLELKRQEENNNSYSSTVPEHYNANMI